MENIQTTREIPKVMQLLEKWQTQHPGTTLEDFYNWLSVSSADRDVFLQENTQSEYVVLDKIVIHKSIPL